jgi:hypothetical protein
MTNYASIGEVLGLVPNLSIGASTVPSNSQADALLAAVQDELDGLLRVNGYTLPIPATDSVLLAHLRTVACYGAAAAIIQASPAGDASDRDFWEARYAAGKAAIPGGANEAVDDSTMIGEGFRFDSDGELRTPFGTRDMEF